jgi:osmotically-inducible protein OsmY
MPPPGAILIGRRSRSKPRSPPRSPATPDLQHHRITITAGPDGLVTLTGAVATQSLRREVELSCWTVAGVQSLHDNLIVAH